MFHSNEHAFGDRVLQKVATCLRSEARRSDTLCRIGGEEFLVVCSGSDLRSTMTEVECFRRAIETMSLLSDEGDHLEISMSVGIEQKEADPGTPDVLLRSADKVLYAAKHAGRNRICVMAHVKLHHGGTVAPRADLAKGTGEPK